MRLRLWLYVLCWQYTAADTSWESTAATYGPRSNRARGRCRCGVGGPSRRGTASYRASSSSPCPAPTRSPGKGCILRFSVQDQILPNFICWFCCQVGQNSYPAAFLNILQTYLPYPSRVVSSNWKSVVKQCCPAVFCGDYVVLGCRVLFTIFGILN